MLSARGCPREMLLGLVPGLPPGRCLFRDSLDIRVERIPLPPRDLRGRRSRILGGRTTRSVVRYRSKLNAQAAGLDATFIKK